MVAEVQTNPLRSPSFSPGSPDPGTMKTPGRDRALDIVKGVLVVLMALYLVVVVLVLQRFWDYWVSLV